MTEHNNEFDYLTIYALEALERQGNTYPTQTEINEMEGQLRQVCRQYVSRQTPLSL